MALPQPRHGELRSHRYNTGAVADKNCVWLHAPVIPFPTYQKVLSVCFLKLRNAQRRYLKTKPYNLSKAPQTNHRTPETRIPMSITPPSLFLHLLHLTTRFYRRWLSVLPQRDAEDAPKRGVLSLRVHLLVLTLIQSPQNDSVPVASSFEYPLPVAMIPTVQTRTNASKRSRIPSTTDRISKRVQKTPSSAVYR